MSDTFFKEEPYFHLEYKALKNEATARLWQNPTGLILHLIKSAYRGGDKHFSTRCKAAFADGFICAEYSIPALAREFGASDRSVSTWLDKLIEMGVLGQPSELQLEGKPAVYVVGYWSPYRKQDGSSGKVFAYYLNEPLPPTHAESCMATHAESCMAPHAESCMPTHAESCMQHEISNSTSKKEVTESKAAARPPKKILPGSGDAQPSGIEPSTPGKAPNSASGRGKVKPPTRAEQFGDGGGSFRHPHEDFVVKAWQDKFEEVHGNRPNVDDRQREKIRMLLRNGPTKDDVVKAINFYMHNYRRFKKYNDAPSIHLLCTSLFNNLVVEDKSMFVQDAQNTMEIVHAGDESTVESIHAAMNRFKE